MVFIVKIDYCYYMNWILLNSKLYNSNKTIVFNSKRLNEIHKERNECWQMERNLLLLNKPKRIHTLRVREQRACICIHFIMITKCKTKTENPIHVIGNDENKSCCGILIWFNDFVYTNRWCLWSCYFCHFFLLFLRSFVLVIAIIVTIFETSET